MRRRSCPIAAPEYIPGACNIGAAEIRLRARMGWFGVAASVLIAAFVLRLGLPPALMFTVVVPVYVAAIGLLQARAGFCVGYAAAGSYGFGDETGATGTVEDDESRAADVQRARKLNGQASRLTILVSLALFAVTVVLS